MKIFVLLSRVPYPLDKGDKLRAFHQLAALNKRHEVVLCCLADSPPGDEALAETRKICSELHVFRLSRFRILANLAFSIFSRKPVQVMYFYQRPVHRKITALIEATAPDHIYCQLIRTAEYVKNEHNYTKTIDYQDALSKGMDRRAEKASWPFREIFASERRRLIAYENIIFEYFEAKTIISAEDRRYIYHPERKDIAIITNGIDTDFFRKGASKAPKYDLVFTGNMSYPPNIETAEYIVHRVLPLLQKQMPGTTLLLAGSSPARRVKALASVTGVTVSGWMDDIRDAYRSGKVFFAPMQIGTGLQNKLLEAMAMELPCVTSTLANKALQAPRDTAIVVEDDAENCALRILALLNNPEARKEMGAQGRTYVTDHFSWQAASRDLENLMERENQKAESRLKGRTHAEI
ncbi:MAG: glycosyltransferase [Cryomorphaceae bacterium]